MCLLLRTAGGQAVAIQTVLPEIGLFVSSALQHRHFGPHEEVEEQCVRRSGLQIQHPVEAQVQHICKIVDVPVFYNAKRSNSGSLE